MPKLSISRAWDESRAILARDGTVLGSIVAAFVGIPTLLYMVWQPGGQTSLTLLVGSILIGFLLSTISSLAVTALVLQVDHTPRDAIGHAVRKLPRFLAAFLIFAVPMALAVVLTIYGSGNQVMFEPDFDPATDFAAVSGMGLLATFVMVLVYFYFAVRLMMTSQAVMAEELRPIDLLRRSWLLTKGHFWRIFATFILLQIAGAVAGKVAELIARLIASLVSNPAEPWSVGALIVGLVVVSISVALGVIGGTIFARIYAQLAVQPGVPDVEAD